jgi:hypothetical protein
MQSRCLPAPEMQPSPTLQSGGAGTGRVDLERSTCNVEPNRRCALPQDRAGLYLEDEDLSAEQPSSRCAGYYRHGSKRYLSPDLTLQILF